MTGRQIRIFLVDGSPTGVLTAEIINWTGKLIVCPRSQLAELAKRAEINKTGLYCLVGPDPGSLYKDRVYIGEGDNVFTRLKGHDKDDTKDFWTRCVAIISKDENLTKSHGRYLESRLIALANQANRAVVSNGTAPQTNPLPEADTADMEYFLEQLLLVLPVLGFSFLQPSVEPATTSGESTLTAAQRFVIEAVGAKATAVDSGSEFLVLAGSTARKQGTPSWTTGKELRHQLVADHILVDAADPSFYRFAENVAFSSPSTAASVICAANINGRVSWRTEVTNIPYGEWHEQQVDSAAVSGDVSE